METAKQRLLDASFELLENVIEIKLENTRLQTENKMLRELIKSKEGQP